jgi:hypothetical protein
MMQLQLIGFARGHALTALNPLLTIPTMATLAQDGW